MTLVAPAHSSEDRREAGILIAGQLRDLTPEDGIVTDAAQLEALTIDGVQPACAVSPSCADEVAEILKLCSAHGWTLMPAGGFSMQPAGRQFASCDVLLRTDRMRKVVFYDPGDLTIGLESGVTIAQQRTLLAEHRQWIPLPRRSAYRATVGGAAAAPLSGPTAAFFGGIREFCIGVQFVTGDGKVARGGGRVVKNVAGYDLMKLLIGSWGTLGVMTELNFKVFPAPVQTRTWLVRRANAAEIVSERDRILATRLWPMCFEVVSPAAQGVLGVAADTNNWVLAVRATGSDAVLARYSRDLVTKAGEAEEIPAEDDFWAALEDFPDRLAARHPGAILLQIACTTEQVEPVLKTVEAVARAENLLPAIVGRVAFGSFLAGLIPASGAPPAARPASSVNRLRSELSGVLVNAIRMPVEAKAECDPWDVRGANAELMAGVKRALDPAGILNRGRYIV